MSRYKRLFNGPLMLLLESSDPALAFWGRLASVMMLLMVVYPMVVLGMRAAKIITSSEIYLFFAGYPVLWLVIGIVALGAGRAAARMPDDQRAGALPEVLVATGRTSRLYWEGTAIFGALLAAGSIFLIALIVVGEL